MHPPKQPGDGYIHAAACALRPRPWIDIHLSLLIPYVDRVRSERLMVDLLKRLYHERSEADCHAADAARDADRAEKLKAWDILAAQHRDELARFEVAVGGLKHSLTRMREIAVEQAALDAQLRPDVYTRLSFARFQQSAIDAYLSVHLASLLPRLRIGSTTATDAIRAGKPLTEISPFARKIE